MTALHRDLSAPEIWQRSFERSRRRRAVTPKLRRQVVRRKGASTAMAAAMLAGPAAQFAGAQTSSEGSGSGGSGLASESPANRAIAGGDRAAQVMLSIGSAGEAVKAVQGALGIEATGVFGEQTAEAVRVFQADVGLAVDGIVGPRTWRALFGGSGTGPAATGPAAAGPAAAAPSGPVVVASPTQSDDRTPVGERTQFAVRMASADELDADELEKLGVSGSSSSSDQEGDGGLVAIQFRAPDSADESEPSGAESHSEPPRVSVERSSASAGDSDSSGEDDGRDERDRSEQASAGSTPPKGQEEREDSDSGDGSAEPKPDENKSEQRDESQPRDDGEDAVSGSCSSRRLVDPLKGKGTFSSGWRTGSRPSHAGIDISAPSGTPIYAAACGVINHISSDNGYGNFICVRHSSSGFTTCYAHLSQFSDERMGDSVRSGEVIGYVGSTGSSTGPHLHFETRTGPPYGRNDVDPRPYLNGQEFSGTPVSSSSPGLGGPDLQESEGSERRQVSTANREPATEERSAVAIATDSDEPAPEAPTERGAPADRPVAAESKPAEPTAEQPAPEASESEASAEEPPAGGEAEAGGEARVATTPAEEVSAESDPQVAEVEEPPVEETTSGKSPADEFPGASEEALPQEEDEAASEEGSESSTPIAADAASNGSDPSTGGGAEQPSAGGDEAATAAKTGAEGGSGSAGSVGDGGSGASTDGSASVESGTTATSEAPDSTAATGSGSASGSAQAETSTATAPSESAAVSTNGSTDATASGGSEASTATGESASGAAASDASTEAYFSEDESGGSEPGAGD